MKIVAPRILRDLCLKEYGSQFGELKLSVWVNPPLKLLQEHDDLNIQSGELTLQLINANNPVEPKEGESTPPPVDVEGIKAKLESLGNRMHEIFSELWSQGAAETRVTVEEIRELIKENMEKDPDFWFWLRRESLNLIREHRGQVKKEWPPRAEKSPAAEPPATP